LLERTLRRLSLSAVEYQLVKLRQCAWRWDVRRDRIEPSLNAPAGTTPDSTGANNAIRMMQNVTKYQLQGLMTEQDAKNYIRFEVVSDGTTVNVSPIKVAAGTRTSLVTTAITYGGSVWLRMQKSGNTWAERDPQTGLPTARSSLSLNL
jgi:hypothetical protein